MWYVYILECQNRALYTGITNDLKRRIAAHKSGQGGRYTRSFGVRRLVYQERFRSKGRSLKREAQIKSWPRNEKWALIRAQGRNKQRKKA